MAIYGYFRLATKGTALATSSVTNRVDRPPVRVVPWEERRLSWRACLRDRLGLGISASLVPGQSRHRRPGTSDPVGAADDRNCPGWFGSFTSSRSSTCGAEVPRIGGTRPRCGRRGNMAVAFYDLPLERNAAADSARAPDA